MQQGPKWLLQPRSQWPSTRDFCRENFPEVETRNPIKILVSRSAYCNPIIISALELSHTYDKAVHCLARSLMSVRNLLRWSGRMAGAVFPSGQATTSQDSGEASRPIILDNYPQAMSRASQLLFEDAMGPTDDLLTEGYLTNLHIKTVDGINQSLHSTVGRF